MAEVAEGLELDAKRMRANLDITKGVICAEAVAMALVPTLGKTTAHRVVEDACRQALARDVALRTVLAETPQVTEILSADTLDRLCDPRNATGLANQLIQRALARRVE
jgi:3-carboxy-cis,cis-muconate cycloisomerase